jgi:hypothetical protein
VTSERRKRGPVELAVWRFLRDAPQVSAAHDALGAQAIVLARSLDFVEAGRDLAAVARELRATLEALSGSGGKSDDGFAAIVAGLSASVGNAP